jgi:maleylacetoacetate isomerase/maleylpyruvate isomerase
MSTIIACDIHPVNNLRILKALARLEVGQPAIDDWVHRWIGEGFAALEPMVARHGAGFAVGDAPTMADCCLVPQVYNARRFKVDLTPFPALVRAADAAAEHPAIAAAHPNNQPDAQV